ncbi:MAG: 2,3-cyclic 3-phosphodiesterase [Acidobacteriota bacterium]|jgi:2'-5' RNA ligase|nr:2,3-cyclic 3-phosphodiesterase [Acidobacteriota bacterium]
MSYDEMNRVDAEGRGQGESIRLFFALELPDEVRDAAASHVARLRRDFPGVRVSWPRPANLHLTLKFMGEVEASRVESLSRAASVAAAGLAPFRLSIESAGVFPPRGAARVLWLGVHDDSGQLALLQRRLEDECAALGFEREPKSFKPHLTLARLRTPHDASALSEAHRQTPFGPHAFDVSEFVMMRSELGPGGSRYTPLSRHSFLSKREFNTETRRHS